MTVFAWPSILAPQRLRWAQPTRGTIYAAPRGGSEVTRRLLGERWSATLSLSSMENEEWQDLQGLLASLDGLTHQVAMPDPAYNYAPQMGGASGSITATANADSGTINLSGISGGNPALKRGQRFMAGGRLYMATAQTSHASGSAAVPVWPRTRAALAGATVTLTGLTCPMRLLNHEQATQDFEPPALGSATISFIEPLP